MLDFEIVIVNHNTRDFLRACLESALAQPAARVSVVDNQSSDGSAEMVRREFSGVWLYENPDNRGYGAAANQGIAAGKSRYILLLNSDTALKPAALEAMSEYMERNPRVGLMGPKLLNPDGTLYRSCFPFPTPGDILLDVGNFRRVVGWMPYAHNLYLRTWDHASARRVPWVQGSALAVRRSAFEQIGGFDETFFMYYEEVDLCKRLWRTGWEVHFAPVTEVIHVGGASTRQRKADMTVQFYASLAHFYRRHYSKMDLALMTGLVRGIVLARLARDSALLGLARDAGRRASLTSNITAWRCLLETQWRNEVAYS